MARRRKPGTPGRTTIPPEVVKSVTKRPNATFKKFGDAQFEKLEVVAQQHYLYLETRPRPREILPGLVDARLIGKQRPPAKPLGRMVWTGDVKHWRLELYKWSDEWWDERNDASCIGGTPEEC